MSVETITGENDGMEPKIHLVTWASPTILRPGLPPSTLLAAAMVRPWAFV